MPPHFVDGAVDTGVVQDGTVRDSTASNDARVFFDSTVGTLDAHLADAQPCAENRNDEIRLRLMPQCGQCHTDQEPRFFSSLRAFETLLVGNPAYVDLETPENSGLLALLEGRSPPPFTQMPLGESFASLAERGETEISMDEIREWLQAISAPEIDIHPNSAAVTTRLVKAEEVQEMLFEHLGLTMADFVRGEHGQSYQSPTVLFQGRLPLYSANEPLKPHRRQSEGPKERMANLGAPDWLNRIPRSTEITPQFLQTLVQVSQSWCQTSIEMPENMALFRHVSRSATSAEAGAEIHTNLAYLHLRFLGEPATEATVNSLYQDVFLPHETQGGPERAWRAVCAFLIRHPLWLSY